MSSYRGLIERCEAELRAGRAQDVVQALSGLNSAEVPLNDRLPLANLAKRSGLLTLALRLLGPIVRPDLSKQARPATAPETAAYALCLQRAGAVREAEKLLEKVDASVVPEARLYRALCQFNQWNYTAAIPQLEAFIASRAEPYLQFVGKVNLAAALVALGRHEEALELLSSNIETASSEKYLRLHGNSLELRAQVFIARSEYSKAKEDLEAASRMLGGEKTLDQLFVQKWFAVLDALQTGSTERLASLKSRAREFGDWESAREADFYSLRAKFDQGAFEYLLFGTPYSSYRERILREIGSGKPLHREFVLGSVCGRVLELATGSFKGEQNGGLKSGQKSHQLLALLTRDFYRPLTIGGLFAELFPGEYFDIFSSPNRVHQAIWRARQWIRKEELPLRIKESNGSFSVEITGVIGLAVSYEQKAVAPQLTQWEKLKSAFPPGCKFTATEARVALNMSPMSFKRFARWATTEKLIGRVGASSATGYVIFEKKAS